MIDHYLVCPDMDFSKIISSGLFWLKHQITCWPNIRWDVKFPRDQHLLSPRLSCAVSAVLIYPTYVNSHQSLLAIANAINNCHQYKLEVNWGTVGIGHCWVVDAIKISLESTEVGGRLADWPPQRSFSQQYVLLTDGGNWRCWSRFFEGNAKWNTVESDSVDHKRLAIITDQINSESTSKVGGWAELSLG